MQTCFPFHSRFNRAACLILAVCMAWICVISAAAESIQFELCSLVDSQLTEVLGYTQEEASHFITEKVRDDLVRFWPEDHPDWVYTLYLNDHQQVSGTTPFDTGYIYYRGENTARWMIKEVQEKGFLDAWTAESLQQLLLLLKQENIRACNELLFSDHAGNALHGLFESLYGPEIRWPESLQHYYQSMLDEHHLERSPLPFHVNGIRQVTFPDRSSLSVHTLTLFEHEVPDSLSVLFADPRLDGWDCTCGVLMLNDWSAVPNRLSREDLSSGSGLAAFEKDGKRFLVQLENSSGEWNLVPIGENALYADVDYRITYNCLREAFAIEYLYPSGMTKTFYVSPDTEKHFCSVLSYETVDPISHEVRLMEGSSYITALWKDELKNIASPVATFYPSTLGLVPMDQMPFDPLSADQGTVSLVPEDYAVATGVQFRTSTSTHSRSHGELLPGTVFPVLNVLPGSPNEWIQTRIGILEGYVASNYVSWEEHPMRIVDPPLLAKSVRTITLKKRPGLLAGSIANFPEGTNMHVIIDGGDWLYVDVPSGDMNWFMDPQGTFGYVSRKDVDTAYTEIALDWMSH